MNDQLLDHSVKLAHSVDIVAAYVANNQMQASQLPEFLESVYKAVGQLEQKAEPRPDPAVPINKSVTDAHIICLEDGMKLKMLKRYLRTKYNLSPEEYRARWGLPHDYPMVAPEYARRRSDFAKQIGLGTDKNKGR